MILFVLLQSCFDRNGKWVSVAASEAEHGVSQPGIVGEWRKQEIDPFDFFPVEFYVAMPNIVVRTTSVPRVANMVDHDSILPEIGIGENRLFGSPGAFVAGAGSSFSRDQWGKISSEQNHAQW
jgi:hypothetical protein